MTVLQERPDVVAPAAPPPPPAARPQTADSWFNTGDHKRLGLLFIYTSLAFLAASAGAALVVAGQSSGAMGLNADRLARLYGLHTQSGILLFLTAMWIGLATYIVPLQIGAGRLALPRLTATAYWTYLFGGALFLASYLQGQVNGFGLTQPTPIAGIPGGASSATVLWILSVAMVAFAFLLASGSLLITVLGLRTDGMTMLRMPAFSWATLVSSSITMVATPVFLGGMLLFGVDQRFGGHLLSPSTAGSLDIWQHTLWLYGRPDVFLLTIVAVGATSDIVATHAHRPLLAHRVSLVLLAVMGAPSLGSWVGNPHPGAVVVPTTNLITTAIVVPLGLTILMWLATMALGRPRFHVSLLFVIGAILLWVGGAATALAAALHEVDGLHGLTAWVAGNVHMVVVGPPTLLALGALYHWAPKLWGRTLSAGAGALVFLAAFVGLAGTALAYYFLGFNGASVAPVQLAATSSYQQDLYGVAEAGGVILAVGLLLFLGDLLFGTSMVRRRKPVSGDPYQGLTLEWATTSPPPPWGFDAVPEVRSEAPLQYMRDSEGGVL